MIFGGGCFQPPAFSSFRLPRGFKMKDGFSYLDVRHYEFHFKLPPEKLNGEIAEIISFSGLLKTLM
jgi:hypothetical protein